MKKKFQISEEKGALRFVSVKKEAMVTFHGMAEQRCSNVYIDRVHT